MGDFEIGEVVNVTIKGVRIARPRSATSVTITAEHDVIYQMPPQAAVERVAPALWPPCCGDLWRDGHKRLWLACTLDGQTDVQMVCASTGELRPPEYLLQTGSVEIVHHEPDRPPF